MSTSITGLAFLTIFLVGIGLAPSMPWFRDTKAGHELSLFQLCAISKSFNDDDYYGVSLDDIFQNYQVCFTVRLDGLQSHPVTTRRMIMVQFENNRIPKGLSSDGSQFFEYRDAALGCLAMVLISCTVTISAACCGCNRAVAIVFASIALVFNLATIGCAYEMKDKLDNVNESRLKLYAGFFVALLGTLASVATVVVAALATRGVRVDFFEVDFRRAGHVVQDQRVLLQEMPSSSRA
eukprot:TRINITY_DN10471_c0_g2_i3.p1 TRINITY_DN10471_c0_g2~~TRINITY_DN10471_c0_g2_i3.p1  ORF type:complete len:237 (+),score=28.20 TRINITY_DN10471_c0_g2_i3:1317-2027(+)